MKLTPLDIHHKEFRHSIRGYSEDEVDQFLDEVADEFERLFKENIDLSEKLEAANEKIRSYLDMEKTLNNTMLAAQSSAEEIRKKGAQEAELMLRDAELKAKDLVHAALAEKQKTQSDFARVKQAEDEFRMQFRSLLETHLRNLTEIPVPEDVRAMSVQPVAEWTPVAAAPVPVAPAPEPAPQHAEALIAEPLPLPEAPVQAPPAGMPAAPSAGPSAEEPPAAGFVTSVHLGEMTPTDLAAEEPSFAEPPEFAVASFDGLGERDEDVDIEQID
jgi:cell division initiation protein